MPLELRIILIIASILILVYILYKIRQAKFNIVDSIFWIVLAVVFLIFAVFPGIASAIASLMGIQTPINFILVFIMVVLLLKVFLQSIRISQQDERIKALSQKIGIDEFERRIKEKERD